MNFIEEFRKIESAEFGFFILVVCGSVCPGVLSIWMFDPVLVNSVTTPKLIILALSFMLPYVSINSLIIGLTTGPAPNTPENKRFIQLFLEASAWSLFIFGICMGIRFSFEISLPRFVIFLAALETFFLLNQLRLRKKLKSQERAVQGVEKPNP